MTVYVVDIEDIPSRYSGQWRKWIPEILNDAGLICHWIGFSDIVETKTSEFLSFIPSNDYKARQTQTLANLLSSETIQDGDVIFFLDAWHPGVIALRQMLLGYKYKPSVAGFWHAGSYDSWDLLGQQGRKYFKNFERAVADCLDVNMFATEFSRNIFELFVPESEHNDNLTIVGFPYYNKFTPTEKEDIIVFPHRIALEKQPYMFDELEKYFIERGVTKFKFVKTIEETKNKEEYHALLAKAKYSISFARQETFGISMIESALSGCVPIVPDGLSYKELYSGIFRYNPMQKYRPSIYAEIFDMVQDFENNREWSEKMITSQCECIKNYISGKWLIECLKSM